MSQGGGTSTKLKTSNAISKGAATSKYCDSGVRREREHVLSFNVVQVYLYRLFRDNEDDPKRIKMEAIRKAFPSSIISESVIRKVLKTCADFKREGKDGNC